VEYLESLLSASDLRHQPAALALVAIGDPAVAALQTLLDQGKPEQQWIAVFTLKRIGTPNAISALRNAAPKESDPSLAEIMKTAS
jgi:HEAT repeat protein